MKIWQLLWSRYNTDLSINCINCTFLMKVRRLRSCFFITMSQFFNIYNMKSVLKSLSTCMSSERSLLRSSHTYHSVLKFFSSLWDFCVSIIFRKFCLQRKLWNRIICTLINDWIHLQRSVQWTLFIWFRISFKFISVKSSMMSS